MQQRNIGSEQEHLRRYTDIPALVYLLRKRKLTLLDPQSWDDRNDSHYLRLYREKKKLESVLALCFTQARETYHHWRVFANGSSGVCIRFKRSELLKAVKKQPDLRTGTVRYLKLTEMRDKTLAIRELPFLKRYPFEDENEFRMIYESKTVRRSKLDIAIPLSSIERVTLSPWLQEALAFHVKRVLKSIRGCSELEIARSTLVNNEEWKNLGECATEQRSAPDGRMSGVRQ
jgi:hypothetical protein